MDLKVLSALSIFIGIVMYPHSSLAADKDANMTALEVYARCHLQLAATPPDPSSQIYKDIQAGKIPASEGCARLIDLAKFNASGVMVNSSNPTAQKVLERIHHIHRNWFIQKAPLGIAAASYLVNDYEEPALYLTRSALFPNAKFSETVTLNHGLKGVRAQTSGQALPYRESTILMPSATYLENNTSFPKNELRITVDQFVPSPAGSISLLRGVYDLNPSPLIRPGVLRGVANTNASPIVIPRLRLAELLNVVEIRPQIRAALESVRLNSHFGGGIIGSQGYILTNTNLNIAQLPREESIIHRRLTTRIHEDLLCHQFPNLRPEDVTGELIPSSPHTFRHSTSCMQCHSTMDPAAQAYRNIYTSLTRGDALVSFRVDFAFKAPVLNNAKAYHTQTPNGRLKYRRLLDSQLVTLNVNSLQQIGNHIASTNDFYLCAAKKYYHYFTGVDVQLLNYESKNTPQALHQDQVIALSQKLKTTQSVRETLKTLFQSAVYQSRDFLAQEVNE